MTAPNTTSAARVSIHGGHSKEFGDANDSTLEEVVRAYVDKGFEWVGNYRAYSTGVSRLPVSLGD